MSTTILSWPRLDELHRLLADLGAPVPRPHLLAFRGDDLLATVFVRPFDPGAHQGPLIEALALALPMGADRVSVALTGRAWSLDDPVAPVADGVDLRQRVLVQTTVDGHGRGAPTVRTLLHPFALPDPGGPFRWDATVDPGPGEGWIPDALATLVAARDDLVADTHPAALEEQRQRLESLGHDVVLSDLGERLLAP